MLDRLRRLLRRAVRPAEAPPAPLVLRAPRARSSEKGWAFAATLDEHPDMEMHVLAEPAGETRSLPTPLPFIPMAILLAARAGRDLHVDCPVDDGWWFTLRESFVPLLAAYYDFRAPLLTRLEGHAESLAVGTGRGLLFSAGVDSFFTLGRMRLAGTSPDCLICVNAGAHGTHRGAWERKLAVVTEIARRERLGVLAVDTNFHELFPLHHQKAHTFRNFSAALALHPWVNHLVYSAGNTFEDVQWEDAKSNRLAPLDYFVTGSLLPPPIGATHAGWGVARPEKTAEVAGMPLAARWLDVCLNQRYQAGRTADEPANCGQCAKCLRTLFTLEHIGALERFAGCFPSEVPGLRRAELLAKLEVSENPLDQEVVRLLGGK